MKYRYTCIMLLLLAHMACKSKPSDLVKVTVDHDKNAVSVTGLSEVSLYGLKQDSISLQAWQTLLVVCKMPADTELRSAAPMQPGKYLLKGNNIIFTPDTPFVKGATYFARYYHFDDGLNSGNMIIDHREPGKTPYTELIFNY